jgi:hypothetical protein
MIKLWLNWHLLTSDLCNSQHEAKEVKFFDATGRVFIVRKH